MLARAVALVPLEYIWVKAHKNIGPRQDPTYIVFE
jgi:hypothetical protein